MCFPDSPKPVPPAPAPPTFEQANTDEEVRARDRTRDRLKGAMNTRQSMLTQNSPSPYKTLTGQ
ncbi:MAG: hypothetical protein LBS45_00155 [Synergistaceae bacterium]|jgi:hypothetical protein|nr:hypothetical protein [Synergistaceae bacterium]